MNQLWRVSIRLFSQRDDGFGNRTQGRVSARAIRGIPRSVGLINWSKKLSVTVKLRGLFLVFLCFDGLAH